MPLSEEEKRMVRAYNIGYELSTYEPKMLEKIIKANKNNEFVKMMRIGRDHREFHANIPRKDYTPEFKNGFYNGRTLAENNPKLLDRLETAKGVTKDYRAGMAAAKQEYALMQIKDRMKAERENPKESNSLSANYSKGFNVGYRLSKSYKPAINYAVENSREYSQFAQGLNAGMKQYDADLTMVRKKDSRGKLFPDHDDLQLKDQKPIEEIVNRLYDTADSQLKSLNRNKPFGDVNMPKWMQDKAQEKTPPSPEKDKIKDKGLDHDR